MIKNFNYYWYFLTSGYSYLISWYFLVNIKYIIDKYVEKDFDSILYFYYTTGLFLSFVLGNKFLNNKSWKIRLNISYSIICFNFILTYVIIIFLNSDLKKYLLYFLMLLNGFFSCFFYSNNNAIAGPLGKKEIKFNSIGITLSGLLSCIIKIIINSLVSDNFKQSLYLFIICIITLIITFVNNIYFYNKFYTDIINKIEYKKSLNNSKYSSEIEFSFMLIIKKITHLMFGVFFLNVISFSIIPIYISKLNLLPFTKNIIQIGLITFKVSEIIGSILPNKIYMFNLLYVHIIGLLRIFIVIYYLISIDKEFSFSFINLIILLILGFSSGFLRNCYYFKAPKYFKNNFNKKKASYYIIFSYIVGKVYGSITDNLIFN